MKVSAGLPGSQSLSPQRISEERRFRTADSGDSLITTLEGYRDFHFRRIPSRRIRGEAQALRFINEVGFCTAFTAGLGIPCLREAIEGRREPPLPEHIQHDYAIGAVWRFKETLPLKGVVYYGKAIAGRPAFISLKLLPAFVRLRVNPCGYKEMYRAGALSHCAKLVMDTLSRRGPSETRALKLSTGYSAPAKRVAFDRAMKLLQENFLALKIEERYEPFTYVWDTFENRWHDALRGARALSRSAAAGHLLARYFEIAGYGTIRGASRLLGIEPTIVKRAIDRLVRQRHLMPLARFARLPGTHYVKTDILTVAS